MPGTTLYVVASAPVFDDSLAAAPGIRRRMQLQPERNTAPKVRLREELHHHGLRYRLDQPMVAGTRRRRVNIIFSWLRVAVFLDGHIGFHDIASAIGAALNALGVLPGDTRDALVAADAAARCFVMERFAC